MSVDISVIITAHSEGMMAGMSVQSMQDAVSFAEKSGLTIEKILILDSPNQETRNYFSDTEVLGFKVFETDFKDQGMARNFAVERSTGGFVAFLDADDLWGFNWLSEAYNLAKLNERYIVHPKFNWFFEGSNNLLIKLDQESELFRIEHLRISNYWDALSFASRNVFLENPFCVRAVDDGFAYEDWQWNCSTISKGFIHKVADNTIHFKRRRSNSQTIEASTKKTLMTKSPMLNYSYYEN